MPGQLAQRDADCERDVSIARLAHELRLPLGIILTALKVMREPGCASGQRPRAVIERQAELLRRLVDDLIEATGAEDSPTRP
jgi:signal transduction histidine kinase